MSGVKKEALQKSLKMANTLMGIGVLLCIVPTGLTLVSIMVSGDESFWVRLASLGWAFFVMALLLPVGMALLFWGFGKLAATKRALKGLDEAEDD